MPNPHQQTKKTNQREIQQNQHDQSTNKYTWLVEILNSISRKHYKEIVYELHPVKKIKDGIVNGDRLMFNNFNTERRKLSLIILYTNYGLET